MISYDDYNWIIHPNKDRQVWQSGERYQYKDNSDVVM